MLSAALTGISALLDIRTDLFGNKNEFYQALENQKIWSPHATFTVKEGGKDYTASIVDLENSHRVSLMTGKTDDEHSATAQISFPARSFWKRTPFTRTVTVTATRPGLYPDESSAKTNGPQ